jgi:hypothetical protein
MIYITNKTIKIYNNLLDFVSNDIVPKFKSIQDEINIIIEETENINQYIEFVKFNKYEIIKIINLFNKYKIKDYITLEIFKYILYPSILYQNIILSAKIFNIFNVSKNNKLTLIEFILGISVLSNKSKFMNLIDLSAEIFKDNQNNSIFIEDIKNMLSGMKYNINVNNTIVDNIYVITVFEYLFNTESID